jgi:cellulose synthase/poly-beta-1,6-N-acetylglucosamine synthase-like glycosyltransferase/ActR/RegA family two-component response regulator
VHLKPLSGGRGESTLRRGGSNIEPGKTVRILIVDDNKLFRHRLANFLLTQPDFAVDGMARNGEEAIAMAEQLRPDLIFMDQRMPKLTGVEATRKIKALLPSTRIYFIAADENWRDAALQAGAECFFLKDDDLNKVLLRIRDPLTSLRPGMAAHPRSHLRDILENAWVWRAVGLIALSSITLAFVRFPYLMVFLTALFFGFSFFAYGLKYYMSVALILFATNGNGIKHANSHIGRKFNGWSNGIRQGGGKDGGQTRGVNGLGLVSQENGRLPAHLQPFISIHLPLYNEAMVVDRLLTACTSMKYENYEVIVADDSTDETTTILRERWASHPRVKLSHREDRSGFKGGALKVATERIDPRTEFIAVFDADFVPPPDILHQFLAYFYGENGEHASGKHGDQKPELLDEKVAVVQGYQWHMLNASENWITRGVRTEYSGSYVVERSGQELVGSMKMISGSVFMIRADVLREVGWRTSITEDWELTLRLHLLGYKVLYTPFIQAPAECVANFRQLACQRMRWAEGHTYNVKKYFIQVMTSPRIGWREKLEFIYYAPYYLQAALFIVGTIAWFLSEWLFRTNLPFWGETLGWSLVFANGFALILMNLTGLFLERGVRRNIGGLLSFLTLTYLLVPYQAYAALKGLFEPHEGGWHRTQKTGAVTEVIGRLGLRKKLRRLRPKRKLPSPGLTIQVRTLNEWFSRFHLPKFWPVAKRMRLLHGRAFSLLIAILIVFCLSAQIPSVMAASDTLYLRDGIEAGSPSQVGDEYLIMESSVDGMVFDSVDDLGIWHTDVAYLQGREETGLEAGMYTFNMHLSQKPQLPADWYSVDWKFRSEINLNPTMGEGSVLHLPVLFQLPLVPDLSVNSWKLEEDILFTLSDGTTRLKHEVEKFDAARGNLATWFKIGPLSSGDSRLYMYYGDRAAGTHAVSVFQGAENLDFIESIGSEEMLPGIDIEIGVYLVGRDGSDLEMIVKSIPITIDASTPNSFPVELGNGAAQTFSAAKPRRLSIFVDVVDVWGEGRFSLRNEGAINVSNLETPSSTPPKWALVSYISLPLIPSLIAAFWRRKRLAMNLISILMAGCVALGIFAMNVQKADAAPTSDVNNSNVFWLNETTSPLTYMMYQTQPSGSGMSATNTIVDFYSDTWPAGWQLSSGTSTVYFYVQTTGNKRVDFDLQAGSGSSWTSLGTGTWSGHYSTITLVNTSFSTSTYTFSTGECLRLAVNIANNATVYWDGSYNDSRLVAPTIVVPENVIGLAATVIVVPLVVRASRRRRRSRVKISMAIRGWQDG